MSHKIAWGLFIFAIAIIGILIIFQPFKRMEIVAESELVYAGKDKAKENWYWVFKEEVRDWIEILCKATPIIGMILAFFLKGRTSLRKNRGAQNGT